MPDPLGLDAETFGLACWSGRAHPMVRAHRHDDVELNVVVSGRLDYLFGAQRVSIPAGATSVFWAALPHQLLATAAGSSACWLTVPLDVVLRWQLPGPAVAELLGGTPLVTTTPGGRGAPEVGGTDPGRRFEGWALDLADPDPALAGIALLEMEAYLRRVLRKAQRASTSGPATSVGHATAMATYVAAHFREPLTVDEVAASVHVTPHHAMQVFRGAVGTTIGAYLTQCRLAEAQRLLITTALTVEAIAHAAGFGSSSRLYAACADLGLPPPARYRRQQRQAAGGSPAAPGP
ncbi:helix-turn-helix domain-containing protein [uncultured Friedmanniella sp.]|uniref:helix-turn-helix domain-containing protein n=1 Tax=uncultured Friedmanniella sp. TaxID=335381 RepID=UPI0035CB7054